MDSKMILHNRFLIEIAGLKIDIDSISPRTFILCRHYLSSGEPDIYIKVTEEDVESERVLNISPHVWDITYETFAAYRKIVDAVIEYNIILMHGAVIAVNNSAFMFTAPSGTGKTTHIRKWVEKAHGSYVVNGDKPLIKITENEVIACGTPWSGNEQWDNNVMVPLKAIVLMERSEDNRIEEISFSEAYIFLLQQTHLPSDPDKAKKTLALLSQLKDKVPVYRFYCNNFKEDCFDVSFNTLIKN